MLKVKATVSCPLSITGRTVLAAGYKHAHTRTRTHVHSTVRAAEGYTKGMGREAEASRVRVGICTYVRTWVRVCGGSGTNLHRGEGLCESNTRHEPLW